MAAPWVDAHAPQPGAYDEAFAAARTGAILEFELLDADLASRGLAMGEIIGQGFDSGADVPVVYISPLATEDVRLMPWAAANLTAPCGLHLSKIPTNALDLSEADNFIQKVEVWRVRERDGITEPWAGHLRLDSGTGLPEFDKDRDEPGSEGHSEPADEEERPEPGDDRADRGGRAEGRGDRREGDRDRDRRRGGEAR